MLKWNVHESKMTHIPLFYHSMQIYVGATWLYELCINFIIQIHPR